MKRLYILSLTFLLVIHVIGIGLASGEETATPGLSQFTDSTPNTSSSQHSILDEESMEYDPKDEQETGSDITNDGSQIESTTEMTSSEAAPETPEHLSGPMNADLRDQLNEEVIAPSTTPPATLAEPVPSETSVNTPADDLTDSRIEATEPAEPTTDTSEVVNDSDTDLETPVQKPTGSSTKSAIPKQVTVPLSKPSQDTSTVPSVEQPAKNTIPRTVPDPSGDLDESEPAETTQVSRADELAKQKGILPKMGLLFKEFGKWLGELMDSVESVF